MGGTMWSSDAYADLSKQRQTKSQAQIFTNTAKKQVDPGMNPYQLGIRESRDSDIHPESLAIKVWLDVTGSMGDIPEKLVKGKLTKVMDTIIKHGIPHPQILFGAIGDHYTDQYPVQVGQFESGNNELDKWLTGINLESGGGGQNMESYLLAWYVGARHTSIDCYEKRGLKGFIFTIGDEQCHPRVEKDKMTGLFGKPELEEITMKEILLEAQRMYHVFHIHIGHGGYEGNITFWRDLLGERAIDLKDRELVAEVIATTVAVINGADLSSVVSSFDSHTATAVTNALAKVDTSISKQKTGILTL